MATFKREKATSNKGHYVQKEDLLKEVIECKKTGVLSPKLAQYLWLIAERYSFSPSFGRFSFREDMVSFAVVNLVANWHKFDPERSDQPFSFYTTAVYRSFLQFLSDEKKQRDIRDELLVEAGANPSFAFQEKSKSASSSDDTAFISPASGE